MKKKKRPGPPPGVRPKNWEQFKEAAKLYQFAPGYSGQSVKKVQGTKHLTDWLDHYDSPLPTPDPTPLPTPVSLPVLSPCPPKKGRTKKTAPLKHTDRVREMLNALRPSRERMIDNDPVSLIENYKRTKQ